MTVLKLEISMLAYIVIVVDKRVTLQEIVKPIYQLNKDTEEELLLTTGSYRKKWRISWLKLVLLGQLEDMVNQLDVLKVAVNLTLGNNSHNKSLPLWHLGYSIPLPPLYCYNDVNCFYRKLLLHGQINKLLLLHLRLLHKHFQHPLRHLVFRLDQCRLVPLHRWDLPLVLHLG